MTANTWRIEVENGNDELSFENGMVTIGGRTGVDVVLRDVMVADRHCVITYEDGFVLRDVGSVTGTWVDGARAQSAAPLADGSRVVIGATRVAVSVEDDDGVAVLKLATDPHSFWWQKPGKGAFGNDPDRLALSEARFGRFAALKFSNRLAMIAGAAVLIGATFVASVMEPLADPGPLMPPHARVTAASTGAQGAGGERALAKSAFEDQCAALAQAQGCNVCHETGAGAPERKCAQCHGLEGEMAHAGSRRHPYHGEDGTVADQQHCVLCHTDHNGGTDRKPISDLMVGNCEACHDEPREELRERVKMPALEQPLTAFQDFNFPHSKHIAKEMDCRLCHRIDREVKAAFDARGLLAKDRNDYAEVPYEVCATCHVEGAEIAQLWDIDAAALQPIMDDADQTRWRKEAQGQQWTVRWHGTDDGGQNCLQCHRQTRRGDRDVIEEMKTAARGVWDAQQYRDERALYTNQTRSHADQFEAHAGGEKDCTTCHKDGRAHTATKEERPPRPFWHGLHLKPAALAPANADAKARWSEDTEAGCISCHADLKGDGELTPFDPTDLRSSYHWPETSAAQAACTGCHKEGVDQDAEPLPLFAAAPAPRQAGVETREQFDFPHDLHVGKTTGELAKGCFACHEFSEPGADGAFTQVPRTLPGAKDCSSCHGGEAHENIGGGDCQQCHPTSGGTEDEPVGNSFLWQAGLDERASRRPWPQPNDFEHLSPGHVVIQDCAECHKGGVYNAATLGDIRVPDETAGLCRDCHFEKQYHWR